MDFDDETVGEDAPKVDEEERKELVLHRRSLLKRVGLGAAALTIPSAVLASPTFGAVSDALAADSFIQSHPKWKFVFVNHVTTNPFFVPTIYGAQDACSLLGCSYQWTGSPRRTSARWSTRSTRRSRAKAAGISCCLVDLKAFNTPTENALAKGIPVLAYNADVPAGNPNGRLAYIGQDLYASGYAMGQRIVNLVGSGDVALFIATPGAAEHPAADRRCHCSDQEVRRRQDQDDGDRHRRAPPRRDGEDRRLLPGPQEPEGHVRRRRGLDPGGGPDGGEVRPQEEGIKAAATT